jgi:hypothetical protein
MTTRTTPRLAWATFGLIVLSYVGSLAGAAVIATRGATVDWGLIADAASFLTAMLSFPVVGVLIASRHPRNGIGWLLLVIGLVWEFGSAASVYARYGVRESGSLPGAEVVAALASPLWVPGIGLMGTFLLLLFPDGRLPSRNWRPLAWLSGLVILTMSILLPLAPGSLNEMADSSLPSIRNPLGVEALRPLYEGPLGALLLLLPLCIAACAVSLIRRYRRSDGPERVQLKWLAAGAGTTAAVYLAGMLATLLTGAWRVHGEAPGWLDVLDYITPYAFVLIPVAIGIAILRHRLYEIDVLINRALVYGALTTVLALVYVGGSSAWEGCCEVWEGEGTTASSWPRPPSPSRLCSVPSGDGSRNSSTGASIAASTTRSTLWRPSRLVYVKRSISPP